MGKQKVALKVLRGLRVEEMRMEKYKNVRDCLFEFLLALITLSMAHS